MAAFRSRGYIYPALGGLCLLLLAAIGAWRGVASAAAPSPVDPQPKTSPTPAPTLTAGTATPTACAVGWTTLNSPNPITGAHMLLSVDALNNEDVWAVGVEPYTGWRTLVEHWNGREWSLSPSPNFSPGNILWSVDALSPNEVWAVGSQFYDPGATRQTLTMHWDGTEWSEVGSPNGSLFDSELTSVSAVSVNDVWAVGYTGTGSNLQTLAMHWDGVRWTIVPTPNLGSTAYLFNAVKATATDDVWAVGAAYGDALIEHWDGQAWSVVPAPHTTTYGELNSVQASGPNNVWAAGQEYANSSTYPLLERWNGTEWSMLPVAKPYANVSRYELQSVAALSPYDVWVVGYNPGSPIGYYVQHWNGRQWRTESEAIGENRQLPAIAAYRNKVWVVGGTTEGGGPQRTLVERYTSYCTSPDKP